MAATCKIRCRLFDPRIRYHSDRATLCPIYFGSQADVTMVGWLSSHPLYWRWCIEANAANSPLYFAYHAPGLAAFTYYRDTVETALVDWHKPVCNMAAPNTFLGSILSNPAPAILYAGAAAFIAALAVTSNTQKPEQAVAKTHRIFISFAAEDITYRDFIVGQARNGSSPFNFIDMSVKQPWDSTWKTNCRTKIKGCDGMIVLPQKHNSS